MAFFWDELIMYSLKHDWHIIERKSDYILDTRQPMSDKGCSPVIISRITNVSTDQSAPPVTKQRRNVWPGPATMKYVMCAAFSLTLLLPIRHCPRYLQQTHRVCVNGSSTN